MRDSIPEHYDWVPGFYGILSPSFEDFYPGDTQGTLSICLPR